LADLRFFAIVDDMKSRVTTLAAFFITCFSIRDFTSSALESSALRISFRVNQDEQNLQLRQRIIKPTLTSRQKSLDFQSPE